MKKLTALVALLLFTLAVQGQLRPPQPKVVAHSLELVPVSRILKKMDAPGKQVVRLYRRPNARAKKALSFSTPRDRPRVA